MEKLLILIGILLMILGICIICSGCHSGWTWPGQVNTISQPNTPSGQLWHTVRKSNWLVTLAIPIIALGAVAMFNGAAKLGMSAIIFGCVNLFMALATARFALWMGVFGLIGSVLAVVASILTKNRALREIIYSNQWFKKGIRDNNGHLIADRLNVAQNNTQSLSTKKIVQKVKTKLKLKKEI